MLLSGELAQKFINDCQIAGESLFVFNGIRPEFQNRMRKSLRRLKLGDNVTNLWREVLFNQDRQMERKHDIRKKHGRH